MKPCGMVHALSHAMDFHLQPDFLALWKCSHTDSAWPVLGKRKADDFTAGSWKRRKQQCAKDLPQSPRSPESEMAMFGAFGESCVEDLPNVLVSGCLVVVMMVLLGMFFAESILVKMLSGKRSQVDLAKSSAVSFLRICAGVLCLMAMIFLVSQVLSMTYEGACAI
ncbi:unnamed protein product [Effrenium voratum]|nr:unnamed protein product [Effrenium voratum]